MPPPQVPLLPLGHSLFLEILLVPSLHLSPIPSFPLCPLLPSISLSPRPLPPGAARLLPAIACCGGGEVFCPTAQPQCRGGTTQGSPMVPEGRGTTEGGTEAQKQEGSQLTWARCSRCCTGAYKHTNSLSGVGPARPAWPPTPLLHSVSGCRVGGRPAPPAQRHWPINPPRTGL